MNDLVLMIARDKPINTIVVGLTKSNGILRPPSSILVMVSTLRDFRWHLVFICKANRFNSFTILWGSLYPKGTLVESTFIAACLRSLIIERIKTTIAMSLVLTPITVGQVSQNADKK